MRRSRSAHMDQSKGGEAYKNMQMGQNWNGDGVQQMEKSSRLCIMESYIMNHQGHIQ